MQCDVDVGAKLSSLWCNELNELELFKLKIILHLYEVKLSKG